MDDAKAHLIITTLNILYEQVRGLPSSAAIQELLGGSSPAQATRATDHERNTRKIIASMIRNLEEVVLPSDEIGTWYQSLDELVLRSIRLVLLTQLSHLQTMVDGLQQYVHQDHTTPHARRRLARWLERADMLSLLRAEMLRIDDIWMPYHPGSKQPPLKGTHHTCYRAGVAVAQFAIQEMGRTEAVARFFRDGLHLDHLAAWHHCKIVLSIFELDVNMIPDELVSDRQLMIATGSDVSV